MNVMTVLERIKSGEKIMVTLSQRSKAPLYNLTDGTDVSLEQMARIRPFVVAADGGLFPDSGAQSYQWAG